MIVPELLVQQVRVDAQVVVFESRVRQTGCGGTKKSDILSI